MAENFQLKLDNIIKELDGKRASLLMQSCCAPCSSAVMQYLNPYFDMKMFFYNPNISPLSEFEKRVKELSKLVEKMPLENRPEIIIGDYENEIFESLVIGLEDLPEGEARCFKCYALRLERTAKFAKENKYEFFGTTLSISPYKNAQKLNEIGAALEKKYGVRYLFSDFKKKNGYKRSIELSKEYSLYRQDYCGCIHSKRYKEKLMK